MYIEKLYGRLSDLALFLVRPYFLKEKNIKVSKGAKIRNRYNQVPMHHLLEHINQDRTRR